MEFSAMRNSLMILLLLACGLGNPISYKASSDSSNIPSTNKGVVFVVHNIRPRRSESGGDSFDLGENLLDMNEETMELTMGEKEDQDTSKEATQKKEEVVDVEEKERAEVETLLQRSKPVDNAFDLGENVLDMNEETMELAMEEEVERRGEGPLEVEDSKETPVQAKVS